MKLSDLRSCDGCGGPPEPHVSVPIVDPGEGPTFQIGQIEMRLCFRCYNTKPICEIVERAYLKKSSLEETGAGRRPLT